MLSFYTIIGLPGVFLILLCYFLLQTEKMDATGFLYSFLNLIGAFLILFSLLFAWNLSAALIEVFWIIISFLGIIRYLKRSR
ncbi:hypothetical protein JXQ31_12520 [candidate division KSB1 bacterium]|nr:hypothetical protein [candidate division KSB1 bacterium]